jgi:hypothetical protein
VTQSTDIFMHGFNDCYKVHTLLYSESEILFIEYMFPDVNECNVPAYKPTLCVNAQCSNTNGSFKCICHTGFISDGRNNCLGIYYIKTEPFDSLAPDRL